MDPARARRASAFARWCWHKSMIFCGRGRSPKRGRCASLAPLSRGPVARSSAAGSRERAPRAAHAPYANAAEGWADRAPQICAMTARPRRRGRAPTHTRYSHPLARSASPNYAFFDVGESRHPHGRRPRAMPILRGRLPHREVRLETRRLRLSATFRATKGCCPVNTSK